MHNKVCIIFNVTICYITQCAVHPDCVFFTTYVSRESVCICFAYLRKTEGYLLDEKLLVFCCCYIFFGIYLYIYVCVCVCVCSYGGVTCSSLCNCVLLPYNLLESGLMYIFIAAPIKDMLHRKSM